MKIYLTFEIHADAKEFRGEVPWRQRGTLSPWFKDERGCLSLPTPGTLAKEIMTGHTLPSSGRFRKSVCYYHFWKQASHTGVITPVSLVVTFLQSNSLLLLWFSDMDFRLLWRNKTKKRISPRNLTEPPILLAPVYLTIPFYPHPPASHWPFWLLLVEISKGQLSKKNGRSFPSLP